nr:hypothetical protein [Tanacetum cinerariifolium]
VPSDDSEEEISWNSSDDEDVDDQTMGSDDKEGEKTDESDDDDEEEISKIEESFDPIPRTPEDSEDDGNNEEDQGLRISEEERMHEEEKADELYCDVDINQGRGLQVSQETEVSHVILTPTHSDGQQESSSTSSFVTNLLNPTIDLGMDSIFMTGSSTVTPIPSPQSTMTPSIISTSTTASQLPIPPTLIPSLDLQNLPNFASVFRFEDKVKSLEVNFSNIPASTPSEPATESAGMSTTGTQSRQLSASESAFAEEPVQTTCQMEEPSHSPRRPPTPDRDWNKTLPAAQGNAQSWISALAKQTNARSSFNELLDTPIDFSNFIMNWLGIDTLTPELLAGPTYKLIRGSCNSLTELEYHLEEVHKSMTDQLDWDNPEGQQYPHNLPQPLPLIPDNRGHRVISFEHFINNDLEYLQGGASSQKYTTSVTKTKATDYGHIKWIEDLVPRAMWIQEPLNYDKHAL